VEAALSRGPSARLRAVADAVPPGSRVADVGTDHAQLLVWLRACGRIGVGIGIDVVPGPLAQARRTLADAGVDGVELRQGDGLQPLRPGEVDVVVLAGMGGTRIVRLLQASPAVVDGLDVLVLQPNTEWVAVRRWVAARGWALAGESMVEDRGKHYVVLVVRPRPGGDPGWSEEELELGPRLLVERPPAFLAWLRHELRRTEKAAARATGSRGPDDPRAVALHGRAQRLRLVLGVG
jgi:tRNA (adenine22-N1)-methyltransferase